MKRVVYYQRRLTASEQRMLSAFGKEKAFKNRVEVKGKPEYGGIIFDLDYSPISRDNEQFMRMIHSMKNEEIDIIVTASKERLGDGDYDVYLACKIAEDNGIEIVFRDENCNSKDVIKEYEEQNQINEMNL